MFEILLKKYGRNGKMVKISYCAFVGMFLGTYLILPFFVGDALMIPHPSESDRSVERYPVPGKDPV